MSSSFLTEERSVMPINVNLYTSLKSIHLLAYKTVAETTGLFSFV